MWEERGKDREEKQRGGGEMRGVAMRRVTFSYNNVVWSEVHCGWCGFSKRQVILGHEAGEEA